ncbi:MAG: transglycosylase SLT domain-containing protein [Methylococcaceae bacterium]|nr:transglycosylase SLT domain-containing protein [Methylococcaceae bacterium]
MRLTKLTLIVFIFTTISIHFPSIVISNADAKVHKSRTSGKSKKHTKQSANPGNVWERIRSGIRIPVPNPAAGIETIVASPVARTNSSVLSSVRINSNSANRNETAEQITTGSNNGNASKSELKISEKLRVRQVLMPHKSEANLSSPDSEAKYTKLGRLLLGSKKSESQLTSRLTKNVSLSEAEKLATAKSDSLFKSSVGRIRTRLGLHPDLSKIVSTKEDATDNTSQNSKSGLSNKPTFIKTPGIGNCSDLRKKEIIQLAKEGVLTDGYAQMAQHCQDKQAVINERIAKQVAAYSRGFLNGVSERARPYLYHIVDTLSKHGLPLDLALLPIMESAYKSTALSSASASGLWQFIPSTGRLYGLEQSSDYDARRDAIASTQAAARFLSSLNGHYKGDWLLALAAYNWGPGNVDAAIAKNLEQGLDTDYWSLEMPAETQNYVPRLLALARIFSNPAGFGLNLRPIKNEPYFIKVAIDRENDIDQLLHKDLSEVAKLANFQSDEFNQLNSAYLNSRLTERKPFSFLMPVTNANTLHRSLTFLAKSTKNDSHVLPFPHAWALSSRPDQSKFEMPLLALNLINSDQKPFISGELKSKEPEISKNIGEDALMTVHYLEKGESLKSLAEYYGVSEEKLREVNKFKRKQAVSFGQRLLIPVQISIGIALKNTIPSVLYKNL